jgi:hypothetical protein
MTGLSARTDMSRPVGRRTLAATVLLSLVGALAGHPAGANEKVFTIGNYPVEARASNAVAAKERAIADGQQAAFRSLLKRLVPVSAYRSLAKPGQADTSRLIDSFAVRSERNSSTEYIASYDFVFSADGVRKFLDDRGIPYLDRQAPPITIVLAYRVPPELKSRLPQSYSEAAGADTWLYAWKALDLANSLTPAIVQPLKREIHRDTIKALADGDLGYLRTLQGEYGSETILAAVLEPESDLKKLKVVLVGKDAVQNMYLKRNYRLDGGDFAYTAELAAVLSLAILEGRWKSINVRGPTGRVGAATPNAPNYGARPAPVASPAANPWAPASQPQPGRGGPMTIAIEFRGMGEWQQISRALSQTPQVTSFEVLGLSARGARVSLTYPGSAEQLAATLSAQGLALRPDGGGWRLFRQ